MPSPYLPMVKAMAPKAPIGAAFITMPTMPKKTCAVWSMIASSGLPFSPSQCSAKAKRIANSSTCRISPSAKAPTTVAGMMCRKYSTMLCSPALAV